MEQALELLGEDAGRVLGARRVVGAPAAGLGHRGEELLGEVGAEADRGGPGASGLGVAGHGHEGGRVLHADVGLPVGEEQDLARPVARGAPELLDPLQPAAREVGRAAGRDRGDDREQGVVDRRERRDQVDVLVVGDERELVGRLEAADQERRGLLGDLELRPGHGPGAVDDEGQVQRRPRGTFRSRRRDELEHGVHRVLGLDSEELMLQSNGCLHEGDLLLSA